MFQRPFACHLLGKKVAIIGAIVFWCQTTLGAWINDEMVWLQILQLADWNIPKLCLLFGGFIYIHNHFISNHIIFIFFVVCVLAWLVWSPFSFDCSGRRRMTDVAPAFAECDVQHFFVHIGRSMTIACWLLLTLSKYNNQLEGFQYTAIHT